MRIVQYGLTFQALALRQRENTILKIVVLKTSYLNTNYTIEYTEK